LEAGTDGVATLTLTVPGAGRLQLSGIGRVRGSGRGAQGGAYLIATSAAARKPLTLFATTKAVHGPGTLKVDFKLKRASLRKLAERGLLRVDLTARFTPEDGSRTLTATRTLRLKAFTLITVGRAQLLDDGHRLHLTVRVPRAGRLWARARRAAARRPWTSTSRAPRPSTC
jgi:hypothetical protein